MRAREQPKPELPHRLRVFRLPDWYDASLDVPPPPWWETDDEAVFGWHGACAKRRWEIARLHDDRDQQRVFITRELRQPSLFVLDDPTLARMLGVDVALVVEARQKRRQELVHAR
jgi:hypothetical protein